MLLNNDDATNYSEINKAAIEISRFNFLCSNAVSGSYFYSLFQSDRHLSVGAA